MNYVAIEPVLPQRGAIQSTLHVYAGQRTDRDAGKVTACGLILPASSSVYGEGIVERMGEFAGPFCGDCFPA